MKLIAYANLALFFVILFTVASACQKEEGVPPPATRTDTNTSKQKTDDSAAKAKKAAAAEKLKEESEAKAEEAAAAKKEEEEEKEAKKAQDRVRSRQIAALKDKINQKRTLMQQKQNQKTQFINFRTQVDNASINSFNNNGSALSGLAGGLAMAGGSGNAFGGLLAGGVGAYQIISSMMDEAEQRGEVLSAREAVDQQLASLDGEIATILTEIETMESELDTLIESEASE